MVLSQNTSLQDVTNIYVNDIPIIQSPRKKAENASMSEVGIRTFRDWGRI